jgi:hypothetical protein
MTLPPFISLSAAERASIVRLDVIHVDENLATRTGLGPASLERLADHRASTTDSAVIAEALQRLAEAEMHEDAGRIDARWGIAFVDASDRRVLTAYADKFGVRGVIDGRDVRFERGGRLVGWLSEMFPAPLPPSDAADDDER